MKTLLLCLCTVLFLGSVAFAEKPAEAKGAPINKKCPVEGEDIDPAVTTTHTGKTVAFCCKSCIGKFNKDPETYMKKLAAALHSPEVKKFITEKYKGAVLPAF